MKLDEIPKFIINLKKRPERLESIKKEMEYMGWDYEVFEGIDLDSHVGCTHSHLAIFDIAEERGYDDIMVIEDDCYFMPYAHDLIKKIESTNFDFDYINFSPTLNRKISKSHTHPYLNDLTIISDDPADKGIYATNCILYNKKVFDTIRTITGTTMPNGRYFYAIDTYIWRNVIPKFKSYCPILPLCLQKSYYSDVSGGNYNNFYIQSYNWDNRTQMNIPPLYKNFGSCENIKNKNIKEKLNF